MHNFRNLHIWQKARILVSEIYQISEIFPSKEAWSLTNQARRAAISISSNIAEGSGKSSNKDFARFLEIALSSCFEVETQIILAYDLKYIDQNTMDKFCSSIQEEQKMIYNFIQKLKNEP
jgi:four helix bundle protein